MQKQFINEKIININHQIIPSWPYLFRTRYYECSFQLYY